jgi:hypothetical protein
LPAAFQDLRNGAGKILALHGNQHQTNAR